MSTAQRIFHGAFGRIALLQMDTALVPHAHSECHVLLKAGGADSSFAVKGHRQPLTDRTAVLVNAWEPHGYNHEVPEQPTLILALYIEPAWLAQMKRSLSLSARPDFFSQPCVELAPQMRSISDALITEMMSLGTVPRERVEELLFSLLIHVFERFSEWRHLTRVTTPAVAWAQDARIRRAREFIVNNIDQEIRLDALARECGLSRAQFFHLFRRSTGVTPHMLISTERMRRACEWLASGRTGTLGQLSESLGFSEHGHFTRFFRNHLGAAPSQYQRVVDRYTNA
ncbi:AraC family transcriptional regulator [Aquisalimonas lutea]|uniref:AraC family transcriptional regulator n=1 Tax=Aquisalimonas lutea TaxID=1327750 RepID=UPI0025B5505C|nr:AraC family transcriptional regulator [Aquisalimonas lutea]MDN3516528.1 AraC family transcriptional regulator [Aquisalimonas lutea]